MKFIKDYKEGDRVFDIYLCKHKQSAVTKNGKPYETVILQDKTGTSYHRRTPFTDFSSYSLKYYFLIIPELFGSSANFSKLQKTTLNMRIYTGLHRLVHVQILYFAEEP